jgi:hypothetical protein
MRSNEMGNNGVSEHSRREISRKVADHLMKTKDVRQISWYYVCGEVLKETGYPVDPEDLRDVIRMTINIIIKEHQFFSEEG